MVAVPVLRLVVPADEVDLVADRLWQAGTTGVAEVPAGGATELIAGFDDRADLDDIRARLDRAACIDFEAADSWVDAWAAHASVTRVGSVVVAPPWLEPGPVRPGDVVAIIDPGPTFGHGGHPTTRLALAALAELAGPEVRVLDAGSGSGVLSVVAARFGATVTAVDVDADARRVTAENAATNGVADRIDLAEGLDAVAGPYHLAVANVTVDVHEAIAPDLTRLVPGGLLVLTGVLTNQTGRLLAAHPHRAVLARATLAGWSALRLGPRDRDRSTLGPDTVDEGDPCRPHRRPPPPSTSCSTP